MNRLTSRNKTTQGPPGRTPDPKKISIPLSLILWLQVAILSVAWGTDAGARHYCAAIDLGRSDPDCKRHEPRHRNQQT